MFGDTTTPTDVPANYAGACEHEAMLNANLFQLTHQKRRMLHGSTLFSLRYRMLPCVLTRSFLNPKTDDDDDDSKSNVELQNGVYHTASILRFLTDAYKLDPNTILYERKFDVRRDSSSMSGLYIDLGDHLSVLLSEACTISEAVDNPHGFKADYGDNVFACFDRIEIFHVPQTTERADKLLQQLSEHQIYLKKITRSFLQLICYDEIRGLHTKSIEISKPDIIDLELHYGDEFPDIHEELVEILQEKDSSGITMLHGPPGTGKTNYLRYLISQIKDKNLIYVPPNMINDITKPSLVPFLMEYSNSILIIEDAENIIRDRKQGAILPQQAVSNLLNLSDGLLSDAVHQQIICTFNCDVGNVDPALLREGRLVVEYKFDRLSVENARRLCAKLNIPDDDEKIQKPMTLAEIYALKKARLAEAAAAAAKTDGDPKKSKSNQTLRDKYKQSTSFVGLYM